jgi:hypothetical protein
LIEAAIIFSPLGSVTVTVRELLAGTLLTVRATDPFFFIFSEAVPAVRVTFFVTLDLATVETDPLFAIVNAAEGDELGVGAGVAAVVTSGVGVVVGDTVGAGAVSYTHLRAHETG